jgi:hypothetical protein
LTGGWDDDVYFGVRLSIKAPVAFDPMAPEHGFSPVLRVPDAETRPRLKLGPHPKGFKLDVSAESFCRTVLERIDGGKANQGEAAVFKALLVPQAKPPIGATRGPEEPELLVHALGHGPVGVSSDGNLRRYRETFDELVRRGAVGECEGLVFREGHWLGVRLSVKSPKAAFAAVRLVIGG